MTSNSEYLYTIEEFISKFSNLNSHRILEEPKYIQEVKFNLENLKSKLNSDNKYNKNYELYYSELIKWLSSIQQSIENIHHNRYHPTVGDLQRFTDIIKLIKDDFTTFDDNQTKTNIDRIKDDIKNTNELYNDTKGSLVIKSRELLTQQSAIYGINNEVSYITQFDTQFDTIFNFDTIKNKIDELKKESDNLKNKNSSLNEKVKNTKKSLRQKIKSNVIFLFNKNEILENLTELKLFNRKINTIKEEYEAILTELKNKNGSLENLVNDFNSIIKDISNNIAKCKGNTTHSILYLLKTIRFTHEYKKEYNDLNTNYKSLEENIENLNKESIKFENLFKTRLTSINKNKSRKESELSKLGSILKTIESDISDIVSNYEQVINKQKPKRGSNENINIITSLLIGVLLILVFIMEKFINSDILLNIIVYLSLITGISLFSYNIYLIIKNYKLNKK